MGERQIVIVTDQLDEHVDHIIREFARRERPVIRLNMGDIPERCLLGLELDGGPSWDGGLTITTNNRRIVLDEVGAVWWRRPGEFWFPEHLSEQEREFAREENRVAFAGLFATLDCFWMSEPERLRRAAWKIPQLARAAQLGFRVPRTLVTSDPDRARAFCDDCPGGVIFKVMTDPFLGAARVTTAEGIERLMTEPSRVTRTTRVGPEQLEHLESVRLAPCQFQEYVPKALELRVTIVGDDVFAAAIDSQAHERTEVDWRIWDVEVPYSAVRLPADVEERCLAFMRSYELTFSAMDLILTPEGEYVFIENNPSGQFLFVEDRVPELRLTDAVVDCLVRGAEAA